MDGWREEEGDERVTRAYTRVYRGGGWEEGGERGARGHDEIRSGRKWQISREIYDVSRWRVIIVRYTIVNGL